jgi:hypothetical protein
VVVIARRLILLTDAEARLVRIMIDEALGAGGLIGYTRSARSAIEKIIASGETRLFDEDLDAYDSAAGQMIDGDDWKNYTRGRKIRGNPWRARRALAAARRR